MRGGVFIDVLPLGIPSAKLLYAVKQVSNYKIEQGCSTKLISNYEHDIFELYDMRFNS